MTPEQAVEAAHALKAQTLVPIHYNRTFEHDLYYRPAAEAEQRIDARLQGSAAWRSASPIRGLVYVELIVSGGCPVAVIGAYVAVLDASAERLSAGRSQRRVEREKVAVAGCTSAAAWLVARTRR